MNEFPFFIKDFLIFIKLFAFFINKIRSPRAEFFLKRFFLNSSLEMFELRFENKQMKKITPYCDRFPKNIFDEKIRLRIFFIFITAPSSAALKMKRYIVKFDNKELISFRLLHLFKK